MFPDSRSHNLTASTLLVDIPSIPLSSHASLSAWRTQPVGMFNERFHDQTHWVESFPPSRLSCSVSTAVTDELTKPPRGSAQQLSSMIRAGGVWLNISQENPHLCQNYLGFTPSVCLLRVECYQWEGEPFDFLLEEIRFIIYVEKMIIFS